MRGRASGFARVIEWSCIFSLGAALAACDDGGAPAPVAEHAGALRAPEDPHLVRLDGRTRVVFSRSLDDAIAGGGVTSYLVCVDGQHCVATEDNYLDLVSGELSGELAVHSMDSRGRLGPASATLRLGETAGAIGEATFALDGGPENQCYATAPARVYSPIYGALTTLGAAAGTNQTNAPWSFWQHRSGGHVANGGIAGSNDTYAWDVNLNVSGASSNLDVGMGFFGVGYGTVVAWNGIAPGSGTYRPVLIDHCGWFSGYLHASTVYVRAGDQVTPRVRLGLIGRSGATNDHLHLAVYRGANRAGGLASYDASFVVNPVTIAFNALTTLNRGQAATLEATGRLNHRSNNTTTNQALNVAAVFNNTWWTSSNSAVLSVDGNGRVTGRAAGRATVTLTYSGIKATREITVR